MLDYLEQRSFPRMDIECPAQFRVAGAANTTGAIVKNLSGGGMLMWIDDKIEVGARLSIEILPGKAITPPLSAEVEVIRTYSVEDGNFAVACQITRVLSEDEAGTAFP